MTASPPRTRRPWPGGARRFRWSREEFVRAADDGAFGERTVELIEGEIYEKTGENRPHRGASSLLVNALRAALGDGYTIREGIGLPLGPRSQPKPDVFALRGTAREFATVREEGPEDVALVVEIVDSRMDTVQRKLRVYGAAGLPEYWILDLRTRTLAVHREPGAKGYASTVVLDETATVTPLERPDTISPGAAIAVADLLP